MLKILRTELLKLKGSKVLLIATILPLISILLGGFDIASSTKAPKAGQEVWRGLFEASALVFGVIIFPMLVTVVLGMIARIEHSSNAWKQLLCLPIDRWMVYFTKLIIGLVIILYSLIAFWIGLFITGLILGGSGVLPYELIKRTLHSYYSILPVFAIQFYLSISFGHIGVPLAVGVGATLPTLLIVQSAKYWVYYPWAYPIVTLSKHFIERNHNVELMNFIYPAVFILIILIGCLQFNKSDIL